MQKRNLNTKRNHKMSTSMDWNGTQINTYNHS